MTLTFEEINNLKAGRELDGLIHGHIFGLKIPTDHNWTSNTYCDCVPHYSTNISHAWRVIEKITEPPSGEWRKHKQRHKNRLPPNSEFAYWFDSACLWSFSSSHASEEICINALKAKMA
jgi:hypothetical protein